MSSIKTTQIDGDISVGRNVTMGGKVEIAGSVQIGHNIKIKGWLDAPNVATPLKGLFSTEARLKAAYTDLREGWYALVNEGDGQAAVWIVEDGAWKFTGEYVAISQDPSIADFMDEVNKAIDAEADKRADADKALADADTAEAVERREADRALRDDLTAEGVARAEADATLTAKLEQEISDRKAADEEFVKDKEKRHREYKFGLVDALSTLSTHEEIQAAFKTCFYEGIASIGGDPEGGIENETVVPNAGDRLVDYDAVKNNLALDKQQQRAVITSVHQYDATGGMAGKIAKYDITYSDGFKSKTITLNAQNADAWTIDKTEIVNILQNREAIQSEADQRKTEDEALQSKISTLTFALEAEEEARDKSDSQLSYKIDSELAKEATARTEGDNELASRIATEKSERIAADLKKKAVEFVMNMTYDTITTSEGVEFYLVDVDWEQLASVVTGGDNRDIVLSDGINNKYRLDHVWLSDGMPYGYKLLNGNRMLNVSTVLGTDSQLHVIYKFNEGAVTYDNLGGVKPLVIGLKLGDDGQPIIDEEMTDEANGTYAMVADVTFEQVKAAYDAKRPIYMDFSKWEDGAVLFNLIPVQQILSIGGSNVHLQGVATISNYDGGVIMISFYAANDGENPARVSLLIGNMPWDYNELKNKPQINSKELSSSNNTAENLDLCRKPLVLQFKLDADGNRITDETIEGYFVEGTTYAELKQAAQLHRPIYFNFNSLNEIDNFSQITAGFIPMTYRLSEGGFLDENPMFFANGIDGCSEGGLSAACDYMILGAFVDESGAVCSEQDGEWMMQCMYAPFGTVTYYDITGKPSINGVTINGSYSSSYYKLQDKLESGTNIKTIGGESLLGSGDIGIKTIGGESLLGSGDIGKYNIYCEAVGDALYLRGDFKKLIEAGYVPYLFRRGRKRKIDKRTKATDGGDHQYKKVNKKSLHYYGRQQFIAVAKSSGKVSLIEKSRSTYSEPDREDAALYRTSNPSLFIYPHVKGIDSSKMVVNTNGRIELVARSNDGEHWYPVSKKFRWYIGFALPREYKTQTVRPSEVVSTFAEFFVTQKRQIVNADGSVTYNYIDNGWTFGV